MFVGFLLWVPEHRWRKTKETKNRKQNNSKQDLTTKGRKQYKYNALRYLQKDPFVDSMLNVFALPRLLPNRRLVTWGTQENACAPLEIKILSSNIHYELIQYFSLVSVFPIKGEKSRPCYSTRLRGVCFGWILHNKSRGCTRPSYTCGWQWCCRDSSHSVSRNWNFYYFSCYNLQLNFL